MTSGFTGSGIRAWSDVLDRHVGSSCPGLVAMIVRRGDVQVVTLGQLGLEDATPMDESSIFRIASLSKPIAALGAMILAEEGVFDLDDPVDSFLPELADRRVLTSLHAELDETVPAERPITVDDLLTFRLGFGAIMESPGSLPVQRAEEELGLGTLGPPWPPPMHSTDEWLRRFGSLPLVYQPGEHWLYNTGAHVLGALIERGSGSTLEKFLSERIFEPLGMDDTAFHVPAAKRGRFTTAYSPGQSTGELELLDGVADSWWLESPPFPNAAGWLVSTLADFWKFAQVMIGGGRPLISETAYELMTTDRLTRRQRLSSVLFLGPGKGWGLGMAVPASGAAEDAVPRGFGWNGGTGTTWYCDPRSGMTGILFTQRAMTSPEPPELFVDFWTSAYAAMS